MPGKFFCIFIAVPAGKISNDTAKTFFEYKTGYQLSC
jgi:hypothetical protein